ncbi:glycosyl hydrolase family 32 [Streptomyces sp. SAS_270]|uniref:glycosyl hydrolase family 32 n=1 Tax=Streptomyces sp. SAS_270 TaxID=3412748 RepID=UPI00403C05A2
MFAATDRWVWDFWLAHHDGVHHMFYLQAPKSLGDPELRHPNATIGHATSKDLVSWDDHGTVLTPGGPGTLDATATWTGSVVRGDDGLWRMFYTGSVWGEGGNTQTIALATSTDLFTWHKRDDFALAADARWYERRHTSSWPEEAWRDPWVYFGPDKRWHMLITARSHTGPVEERGVIGHAVSDDLDTWEVLPPMTAPGHGFGHLEVPQLVTVDGRSVLLFSTARETITDTRAEQGGRTGVWWAPVTDGLIDLGHAAPVTTEELYSGRMAHDEHGRSVLLAFATGMGAGRFEGKVVDPMRVSWHVDQLHVDAPTAPRGPSLRAAYS